MKRENHSFYHPRHSDQHLFSYHPDGDMKQDFLVLLRKFGYHFFSPKLISHAEKIRSEYHQHDQELEVQENNREDLREDVIFTIDGEDAKDFDDAVSIKKHRWFYELGVHIADVSYFIKEGSSLDQEARKRGNSVYLVDQVLPMFPEGISNDLCSLKEGEDRMTFSCVIKLDQKGRILNYRFFRSKIRSRKRLTYTLVEKFLKQRKFSTELGLTKEIQESLKEMDRLKTILRDERIRQGSINFVSEEQQFDLSASITAIPTTISKIYLKKQIEADKLIEEFMLIANRCAALEMRKRGLGVYRVHETPKEDKLVQFEQMLHWEKLKLPSRGYLNPLKIEMGDEERYNRYMLFLDGVNDPVKKKLYSFFLLRSMKQACYSEKNLGHYGLAFKDYTHFTSPIRRYPDLIVHRILLNFLTGRAVKVNKRELREIALHTSETEKRASEAEREYKKVASMRYLQKKFSNDRFEKIVFSSVITGFGFHGGIYVQDEETGIEGMVENYYLDPDLELDEEKMIMFKRSQPYYRLGDKIKVKLISLDFGKRRINFSPVDNTEE